MEFEPHFLGVRQMSFRTAISEKKMKLTVQYMPDDKVVDAIDAWKLNRVLAELVERAKTALFGWSYLILEVEVADVGTRLCLLLVVRDYDGECQPTLAWVELTGPWIAKAAHQALRQELKALLKAHRLRSK
jgi:hypothetical protein